MSYNLSGVKKLQLSGSDARQDLPASRSRSGTTRRSPPTTRRPRCRARRSPSPAARTARARRRTSRRSSPRRLRPTGSSARASTINWPSDTQGGNGNAGVAHDREEDRRRDRLRRLLRRQGRRPDVRGGQEPEPASTSRRALKRRSAAASTAAINPDLTYDPIYAPGATSYPITSPTWVLVVQDPDGRGEGRRRSRRFLDLHPDRRARSWPRRSTTHRCRRAREAGARQRQADQVGSPVELRAGRGGRVPPVRPSPPPHSDGQPPTPPPLPDPRPRTAPRVSATAAVRRARSPTALFRVAHAARGPARARDPRADRDLHDEQGPALVPRPRAARRGLLRRLGPREGSLRRRRAALRHVARRRASR